MASLHYNTNYRTILRNVKISGIVPLDTPVLEKINVVYSTGIIIFLIWKLSCTALSIFFNDFEDMMMSQGVSMLLAMALFLCIFYATWRRKLVNFIFEMDKISANISESSLGKEQYFAEMYEKDSNLLSLLSSPIQTSTAMCSFVYCISVPIVEVINTGTFRRKMPVPLNCSFEDYSYTYEIFFVFHFLGLATPAVQKLGNEFIMFSFIRIQRAFLKFLSRSIADIAKEVNGASNSQVIQKIKTWTKLHQSALRNINKFQEMYSPVIIVYYLGMITQVACGMFYQLNAVNPNLLQAATLAMYMVISVLQFYLLCYMCDDLSEEASKIGEEFYCFPWYKLDIKTENHIRLIINMANRPIDMMSYRSPSFIVNKEAFLAFMLNIISAYMGFSKIKGIDEVEI